MWLWLGPVVFMIFAVPITLLDIRYMRIPDVLSLGGICVIVLLDWLVMRRPWVSLLAEAAAGFGFLWLIRIVTGGKLGLGDAKYSAFIALCIGLQAWLVALAAASLVGLACALMLLGGRRVTRTTRIPFAPFLTFGAAVSMVAGHLVPGM